MADDLNCYSKNLSRRYGKTEALNDLTLSIPEGAIYALLGPNGAGKTTTIQTLLNIQHPTSGSAGGRDNCLWPSPV